MTEEKKITVRVRNTVLKQISALANDEGRKLGEMARILLEDALALRATINSENNKTTQRVKPLSGNSSRSR